MFKNNPVLSILIPTRNRAKNLDNTLRRIEKSIEISEKNKGNIEVEIVIINNFSIDETENVAKKWTEKCKYIKYFKHEKFYPTAEESLFNGVKYCTGDYVWCFGDDDYMRRSAIKFLFENSIFSLSFSFILANCNILNPELKIIEYIKENDSIIEYKNGIDLFKDFGLISATTTISCLIFKKNEINIKIFYKISKISSIYSHSCFLLSSFYNKKSCFVSKCLLTYKANSMENEATNIYAVSRKLNRFDLAPFTTGIVGIIDYISKNIKVSKKDILFFHEIEISKDSWKIKHTILSCFILRMFIDQLCIFHSYNLIKRWQNIFAIIFYIKSLNNYLNFVENHDKIIEKIKYFVKKNFFENYFNTNIKIDIDIEVNVIKNAITMLENNIINSSKKQNPQNYIIKN